MTPQWHINISLHFFDPGFWVKVFINETLIMVNDNCKFWSYLRGTDVSVTISRFTSTLTEGVSLCQLFWAEEQSPSREKGPSRLQNRFDYLTAI